MIFEETLCPCLRARRADRLSPFSATAYATDPGLRLFSHPMDPVAG